MPRFFFDFHQAERRDADITGLELAGVEQAYLEAFEAAQDMWSELLRLRHDPRRCSFGVRNEEGDILFVLPFQEVVDCCTDRRPVVATGIWRDLVQAHAYAKRVQDEMFEQLSMARRIRDESRKLLELVSGQ